MPDDNLPSESPTAKENDEPIDRRTAAARAGKFVTYTAPALLALLTAKDVAAS